MNFYFRLVDETGLEFDIEVPVGNSDKSISFGAYEDSSDIKFVQVFGHDYEYYVLEKDNVKFALSKALYVTAERERGTIKAYYLTLFGVGVFQVFPNTEKNPIILNLVPRGTFGQLERLIVDMENVPKSKLHESEIDILFSVDAKESDPEPDNYIKRFSYLDWPIQVLALYPTSDIFLMEDSNLIGQIDLENSSDFEIATESGQSIKARTFMNFKVSSVLKKAEFEDFIQTSFKHDLTIVGRWVLAHLMLYLSDLFKTWTSSQDTDILVPFVSICQSSGTGKSKLAIELLKRNLGFYFVFRNNLQPGYPKNSSFSNELKTLVKNFRDDVHGTNYTVYTRSSIGRILHFFAKIITSYIRVLVKLTIDKKNKDNLSDMKEAITMSISKFAEIFENQDNKAEKWFQLVDDQVLIELYKETMRSESFELSKNPNHLEQICVGSVSRHINNILEDPIKSFDLEDRSNSEIVEICLALKYMLQKFPFVIALDETDFLLQLPNKYKETTAFEDLRRATSFLKVRSKIIFIALGTKSPVIDSQPAPVPDSSSRFTIRNVIPSPIIMTSNCNILSMQFPITKLNPTYNFLKNPIVFKFIATLGRGLWGSYPFDVVVNQAANKLVKGSGDSLSYFLPIWMILAGLSANPLNPDVSNLVSNHMGTLIDFENGMRKIIVMYPSEPILALAAHQLIDTFGNKQHSYSGSFELFKTLVDNIDSVVFDRDEMSEAFAAMAILRAIWKTGPPSNMMQCSDEKSYKDCLEAIKKEDPSGMFEQLWNTNSFLLESSEFKTNLCCAFPDYKICTVEDFLKEWTHDPDFDLTTHGLSSDVSQGFINAKQFIRLIRDSRGFMGRTLKLEPTIYPSADLRVFDSTRNVITYGLLKLGLLRQCGFILPVGHYGINLIVPVCMKTNGLTFIAVQVKTEGINLSDDVERMQARFNFVKCPECIKFMENPNCPKCVPDDDLKKMYENQVSLLISLGDADVDGYYPRFRTSFSTYLKDVFPPKPTNTGAEFNEDEKKKEKDYKDFLNDLDIIEDVFDNYAAKAEPFKELVQKNPDFMEPLTTSTIVMGNDVILSKKIWADAACENQKSRNLIPILKTHDFPKDNMFHRQFCVCTRGWEHIRSCFMTATDAPENDPIMLAKEILEPQGLFKIRTRSISDKLLRTIVYDTAPEYYEYSEEVKDMLHDDSDQESLEENLGP